MSDRYNYLTVALEKDIRDDDAEALINAIMCLRGVLKVKPNVANSNDWLAEERARNELSTKLWNMLWQKDETK
jgi:hypothetical protein